MVIPSTSSQKNPNAIFNIEALPLEVKSHVLAIAYFISLREIGEKRGAPLTVCHSWQEAIKKSDIFLQSRFDDLYRLISSFSNEITKGMFDDVFLELARLGSNYIPLKINVLKICDEVIALLKTNSLFGEEAEDVLLEKFLAVSLLYLKLGFKEKASDIFLERMDRYASENFPGKNFQKLINGAVQLDTISIDTQMVGIEGTETLGGIGAELLKRIEPKYQSHSFFKLIEAAALFGRIDLAFGAFKIAHVNFREEFDSLSAICLIAKSVHEYHVGHRKRLRRQKYLNELLLFLKKLDVTPSRLKIFSVLAKIYVKNGLKKRFFDVIKHRYPSLENIDEESSMLRSYVNFFIHLDSPELARNLLEMNKPMDFSSRGKWEFYNRHLILPSPESIDSASTISIGQSEVIAWNKEGMQLGRTRWIDQDFYLFSEVFNERMCDLTDKERDASEYQYEMSCLALIEHLIHKQNFADALSFAESVNDVAIQIEVHLLLLVSQIKLGFLGEIDSHLRIAEELLSQFSPSSYERLRLERNLSITLVDIITILVKRGEFVAAISLAEKSLMWRMANTGQIFYILVDAAAIQGSTEILTRILPLLYRLASLSQLQEEYSVLVIKHSIENGKIQSIKDREEAYKSLLAYINKQGKSDDNLLMIALDLLYSLGDHSIFYFEKLSHDYQSLGTIDDPKWIHNKKKLQTCLIKFLLRKNLGHEIRSLLKNFGAIDPSPFIETLPELMEYFCK